MKTSTAVKVCSIFLISLACFISGIFFIGIMILRFEVNYSFSDIDSPDTIKTEGVIRDVIVPQDDSKNTSSYSFSAGGSDSSTIYSYRDENGKAYSISIDVFSSSVKKGDEMDVYYNKYDPEKSVPAFVVTEYYFLRKLFIIISIISFMPGIIVLIIGFIIGRKEKSQIKEIAP